MRSLRPLVRLAVRDARRDRWRSLLVLVIVAVPVAGLAAAGTLADTGAPTAEQNAVAGMGRADLVLFASAPADGGPVDDAALLDAIGDLPDGTEVEVQRTRPGALADDGLAVPVVIEDLSLAPDALAAGRRELVEGDSPRNPDAVAVSDALADRADVALGDRIVVEPLGEVTVVGRYRDPEHLSREMVLVAPGALAGLPEATSELLLDLPDGASAADLSDLAAIDGSWDDETTDPVLYGQSRQAVLSERFSQGERWMFIIVGGLAAVEVALVAGAAFAVSVRRRQRELGLLAATGGTRAHVRRSVLLLGVTVGLVGSAAGVVLGLAGSWAALPLVQGAVDRVVTGLRIDPVWVLGAALLGIVAAVAGAWWPARSVAKLPVLTALSGRRPTPTRASRGLVGGLLLVTAGVGLCVAGNRFAGSPYVFLAGSVAVVLGAGLTSPWLLEQLGRVARFLPAGPRLAVRDAARFRARNGPIVTAAMAGLAASVTIAAIVVSLDARDEAAYEPMLPEGVLLIQDGGVRGAADAVAAAVGRPAWPLRRPTGAIVDANVGGPELGYEHVDGVIVVPELAGALAGDAAAEDLAAGRAVALRDTGLEQVEVRMEEGDRLGEALDTFPVVLHEAGFRESFLPQILVPATSRSLAAVTSATGDWTDHVIALDGPVDETTLQAASRAAAELGPQVSVSAERGYQSPYAALERITTVVGGLAGLLIVAVAIALAAAESRPDLRTLTAVGAGRRTRRSLAAGRALLLSGLGGVLAVPVGLLPAASLLSTLAGGPPLVLPVRAILVAAVVVPSLATLGAVLASRREPTGLTRAA